MTACKKDKTIPLLDGSANLIRQIRFTSNRKSLELILTAVECTNDIDSGAYLGVKIQGNDLVFTTAISGLTTNHSSAVSDNPLVSISNAASTLNIIGVDDNTMNFSVTQMNVRYDVATNSVKFQI
ncbi:MAG: hypothetical protein K9J37_22250 [Saprospiraceae bacterium]|nr:hypothetical protein [Saprospiraceae bacterium]MCF8252645.1 hypothetical protein [Saprospiraceae bacterium]MCF8282841.1 hypothetical protein [Bacteroidales bacterium]MCF8314214.1 hypothetical protein [Saprospiraceae bacterium]MCF8443030.1 hypothetical protein [Saprospiraceae bacterium]